MRCGFFCVARMGGGNSSAFVYLHLKCSFSNGGHMFAAANTTLIQLFATYTFENIGNLKGHNGKVRERESEGGSSIFIPDTTPTIFHLCLSASSQIRCLLWNPDDSHLVSCGMDGAIYDWNVQNVKRERECVLKSCSYTSIAITPDLRTTFAVGSDRTLKEVILADSTVSCIELPFFFPSTSSHPYLSLLSPPPLPITSLKHPLLIASPCALPLLPPPPPPPSFLLPSFSSPSLPPPFSLPLPLHTLGTASSQCWGCGTDTGGPLSHWKDAVCWKQFWDNKSHEISPD